MNTKEKKAKKEARKLFPIVYYTLDQASRTLDCEIEDLLHLIEIGTVNPLIKLQPTSVEGHLHISNSTLKEIDVDEEVASDLISNSFGSVYVDNIYQEQPNLYTYTGTITGVWKLSFNAETFFFELEKESYAYMPVKSAKPKRELSFLNGNLELTPSIDYLNDYGFSILPQAPLTLEEKEFLIHRSDIERILSAIENGGFLEKPTLAKQIFPSTVKATDNQPVHRFSNPQSLMIQEMFKLIPALKSDLLSNPPEAAKALLKLIPDFEERSVTRWLGGK